MNPGLALGTRKGSRFWVAHKKLLQGLPWCTAKGKDFGVYSVPVLRYGPSLMKYCGKQIVGRAAVLFTVLSALSALAQIPGAGSPSGVNASLAKLFSDFPGFTAKAELQVLDKARKEWLRTPMNFAVLGNQLRADLDLTKAKNEEVAASAATLKQMGMAEVVSIVRPDKKLVYVLFPGVESCLEMPIPKEEADAIDKNTKIEKTPLGKETVEGHPCVKNKVVVKSDKGQILEATTWNATDLKDFPVKIESREQENTSVIRFTDVQLSKPDSAKFEIPANYARYKNQQDLMMGVARKAMGGSK